MMKRVDCKVVGCINAPTKRKVQGSRVFPGERDFPKVKSSELDFPGSLERPGKVVTWPIV